VSIRFLADENFKLAIVEGLLLQSPGLDIVRVQDVGLTGLDDPTLLAWAAQEGRILLTHDANRSSNFRNFVVRGILARLRGASLLRTYIEI
jgi:predicted nuclease of predicted toxin-antitoxin system